MALQDSLEQLQNFDLGDLDFNNVGSWPGPVKLIMMILLAAVVLGAGYYFYISDRVKALEVAENKEVELRQDFENKSERARNLEAYLQQKEEMQETFGALLRQLPEKTEVPGLLEDITRTAIDNELTIESITLQAENRTEFYVELPIDISVEGDYHKIGSFISSVASLSRIVTLHDFRIQPIEGTQTLKMTILAKTYRYLDEEA